MSVRQIVISGTGAVFSLHLAVKLADGWQPEVSVSFILSPRSSFGRQKNLKSKEQADYSSPRLGAMFAALRFLLRLIETDCSTLMRTHTFPPLN